MGQVTPPGINAAYESSLIAAYAQPLSATLTALASYNTNGLMTQTAPDTFTGRTLTAGSGIGVTNGNGVSGNPTIAIDSTVVTLTGSQTLTNKSIDAGQLTGDVLVARIATALMTPGAIGGTTQAAGSFSVGNITGTGGAGYLQVANQSVAPGTPSSAGRIYFDASNRLAWKGTNGYVRTFDGAANTADRTYTLPDASGTISLTSHTHTSKSITGAFPNGVVAASLTRYLGLNATSYSSGATASQGVMPFAATVKNAYMRTNSTNGAGGALTCTLYVNGSPTTLVITVAAGAAAGTFSDTAHTVSVSVGDTIQWQLVNGDAGNNSAIVVSIVAELDSITS